ncbi:unnamed protein product [Meloidogyne enterolobii]|uniref:Uncharacterized protein n=1 Tax=Meloidogyne enterolobii TaxID=390850 RepID=A0ACB0Y582_MELEN
MNLNIFQKNFLFLFYLNLPLLFSLFLQNKQFQAIVGERISTPPGLIPIPRSSAPTDQAIRVIRAFQSGVDRREQSLSGPSAARLREISRQLKLQVEREGREYICEFP